MTRSRAILGLAIATICVVLWWLSSPAKGVGIENLSQLEGNAEQGELIFHIGGCVSCHGESDKQEGDESPPVLSGGRQLPTPFGTFIAPNISPHPERGIGAWSNVDFANAMLHGVSPEGEHYYPAFPYTSYTRMKLQDIVNLKAYLDSLPESDRETESHELPFIFSIRRGLGFWKRLYLDADPVTPVDETDQQLVRGRYLVEGPGHCAECHTPRDPLGGLEKTRWLAGAPNQEGDGSVPNITPHASGIKEWEIVDLVEYLSSGFTPDYDSVGGSMAEVVGNTAYLSDEDRRAIARYLKATPALEKAKR